jgi:hypothetical protein
MRQFTTARTRFSAIQKIGNRLSTAGAAGGFHAPASEADARAVGFATRNSFPAVPALKADLVPLESLLEVVPDERGQDLVALLHPIHRHPFGCAHQGLQISRRNAP